MALTPFHEIATELHAVADKLLAHGDQFYLGQLVVSTKAPDTVPADSPEVLANQPKDSPESSPTVEPVDNNAGIAEGQEPEGEPQQ